MQATLDIITKKLINEHYTHTRSWYESQHILPTPKYMQKKKKSSQKIKKINVDLFQPHFWKHNH